VISLSIILSLSLSPADPCNIFTFDLSNCTEWKDVAHLSTDPVTYLHAESTITASFDQNTTNGQHHYVFCYKYILEVYPRTIDCVHGNTSVSVNFRWPLPAGNADLLVLIYNSTNYDGNSFQACATTNLSIAREWIFKYGNRYDTNDLECGEIVQLYMWGMVCCHHSHLHYLIVILIKIPKLQRGTCLKCQFF